ncbi:MAG: hypothetical protein GEU73_11450 [Chloroflexi bacterium]|nr:hypothetical protein [Chloroflexota bacterium]
MGSRLLHLAEAEVSRAGIRVLRLDCWAGNVKLRTYYEQAGFECVDLSEVTSASGASYFVALYERRMPDRPEPKMKGGA